HPFRAPPSSWVTRGRRSVWRAGDNVSRSSRWRRRRSSVRSPPRARRPRRRSPEPCKRSWPFRCPHAPATLRTPSRWPTRASRARARRSMIASLRGRLRGRLEGRVILESAGVGYEVVLPPVVAQGLESLMAGDGAEAAELELVIYYPATRDQPRPVLIGFARD